MATEPKIRYDIEAGIKGEADVQALAATIRSLGDSLEGDLKKQATDAAAALEGLGNKQAAVQTFGTLRRESESLGAELNTVTATVDRLGAELPQAAAATQRLAEAERAARTAAAGAKADLDEQRAALTALRAEYTGNARRTAEFREAQAQLLVTVKDLRTNLREQQAAVSTAAGASRAAQTAEKSLADQYERSVAEARRLSAAVGDKGRALEATRAQLSSYGIQTTQLVAAERQLAESITQVRERVAGLAPAFAQAAAASSSSTARQAADQRTVREGLKGIGDQLRQIQSIASVAIGGGLLGGVIKSVADTADEFKNLQARIRLVTGEGDNFSTAFSGVQRIALATNSALADTGTLFTRIARAGTDAGLSVQQATAQALGLTETINQAVQLSGSSAEASSAAITQLIQGLQSGVLRGDEFNSVMEQAPRLAQALAAGVGRTTGELRRLAEQGGLTTDVVVRALTTQSATVAAEFGKLPQTVGRSLQNLQTQWQLYIGEQDKGFASSANLAKLIDGLAKNLDLLVGSLVAAGKAWAAIKIAGLAADVYRWATATTGATVAIQANTAALATNTVAHGANAAAQRATAAATAGTGLAMRAGTAQFASGAAVLGRFSGLLGPFGIAVAALTPEIIGLTRSAAEGVANWQGYGRAIADAEGRLKAQEAAAAANAQAQRSLAIALQEARDKQFQLSKEASTLIAKFDEMRKNGESASDAITKIGRDFDLATVPGIANAAAVLDKLVADGKLSAGEFQAAWSQALSGEDLGVFETRARAAFAGTTREAERLAAVLDGSAREAVKRTGLDFDVLSGKIGSTARKAINDTGAIVANLDRLKRQGVDTGTALVASLSRGIDTADGQKAIEALRGQIEGLRKELGQDVTDGLLQKLDKQAADLKVKMDELKPGIQSTAEAFKFFGLETEKQMLDVARSTKGAYDVLKASGQATADQLVEAFERAAAAATKANKGITPAGVATERAVLQARQRTENYAKGTTNALKGAGDKWKEYGKEVQQVAEDIGLDPALDQRGKGPAIIDQAQQINSQTGATREQRLGGQNAVDNRLMFEIRDKLNSNTLTAADAGSIKAVLAALAQNRAVNASVDRQSAGAISLEGRRDDAQWQAVGARLAAELAKIERPAGESTTHKVEITTPDGSTQAVDMRSESEAGKLVETLGKLSKRTVRKR